MDRVILQSVGLAALCLCMGCTTLGPMPGMTMANPAAEARPTSEVSFSAVPGYHLSDTVQEQPEGAAIPQISGFFEPGELISAPGLGFGGRWVFDEDDIGYFEPMVRYRYALTPEVSSAIVAFGTHARGAANGASYTLNKGGLEFITDIMAVEVFPWAELHFMGGASFVLIDASGQFCTNEETGYGRDCNDNERGDTAVEAFGVYPSAFVGASVEFVKGYESVFHGLRIGAFTAGGQMPAIRFAEQEDARPWFEMGATISVMMGARRVASDE